MKAISVLVKIQIDENLDAHKAIQDADYSFSLNGKELQAEIIEDFVYHQRVDADIEAKLST